MDAICDFRLEGTFVGAVAACGCEGLGAGGVAIGGGIGSVDVSECVGSTVEWVAEGIVTVGDGWVAGGSDWEADWFSGAEFC